MTFRGAVAWRALATAADHRPTVWFKGRLDNLADIAVRAGASPAMPPEDILGLGVVRRGIQFLEHLIGDYAIAIAEPSRQCLHLLRDATGQRALFFAHDCAGVRFGATPGDLELTLRTDVAGLAGIINGCGVRQQATALTGVSQVRPGEIVSFSPEGVRNRWWWKPHAEPERLDPGRDYVGEYRDLLEQAVRCRLPSNAVATHLSGGWDSSAVTSAAAALAGPGRVTAYTAVPWRPVEGTVMRHSNPDEGPLAAETAAMLGVRQRLLRGKIAPFATAQQFIVEAQTPVPDAFQIGWWNAARDAARNDGAEVLLTGELGNLSLNASGLPMLRWLVGQGLSVCAWRESRSLVAAGTVRWRGAAAAAFADHLPAPVFEWARALFGGGAAPAGGFIRAGEVPSAGPIVPTCNPHADRLAQIRDSDFGIHRDLAERCWGLTEADPTADRRLVEWSLRLPSEALLNHGVLRPMARAALGGRFPEAVLASPLRGLQAADWYQQVDADDCRDVLNDVREVPLAREFLDVEAIEQAIAHWPTGDWNSPHNYNRYRIGLIDALCAGLFIARFAP